MKKFMTRHFAIIFICVFGTLLPSTVIFFTVKRDIKRSEDIEQEMGYSCSAVKGAAMINLHEAVFHLKRGENADRALGLFEGQMWGAFSVCFPRDRDHPDDTPLQLLDLGAHSSPADLERLGKAIEDGWARSKVDRPWEGETHW
jgi:hypothetical protein